MESTKIKEYILSHIKNIFKTPTENLRHLFLVPGTGYTNELWGWDSYWESLSLCRAFDIFGEDLERVGLTKQVVAEHIRGSVLNFLDAQEQDGFTPIMVSAGGLFEGFFHNEYVKGAPQNQHLPFLCQSALSASKFSEDYTWLDVDKLAKYLEYYERRQFDEKSGLFFWQNDIMIGIDNNPTVFYRPQRSSADIFLNCFMYLEYTAFAELLDKLHDSRADATKKKAQQLAVAINAEMWDERDGIYYSQDIGVYKTECVVKGVMLHSGLYPHWKSMPLKIRFWGCFLPMYAGICSADQAERMCTHLTENDDLFAEYGIRTLSRNEKMYSLEKSQGNPSNWLGAIWTVANYCVYKGLKNYGKMELSNRLRKCTINLLEKALSEHGDFFESYNPDTGEPFMHAGFLSHNLPIIDMLK